MPEAKQETSQATENASKNQERQWTLELARVQLDPWEGWKEVLEFRQLAEAEG